MPNEKPRTDWSRRSIVLGALLIAVIIAVLVTAASIHKQDQQRQQQLNQYCHQQFPGADC